MERFLVELHFEADRVFARVKQLHDDGKIGPWRHAFIVAGACRKIFLGGEIRAASGWFWAS